MLSDTGKEGAKLNFLKIGRHKKAARCCGQRHSLLERLSRQQFPYASDVLGLSEPVPQLVPKKRGRPKNRSWKL